MTTRLVDCTEQLEAMTRSMLAHIEASLMDEQTIADLRKAVAARDEHIRLLHETNKAAQKDRMLKICSHGKPWKEDCSECERVWDVSFLTEEQQQLATFYNVTSKDALISAMSHHIDKLQAKLPSIDMPIRTVAREG